MKLKDTFVTQEMDGEQVMVEADGGFAGMVRSNATAAFIIDQLKTETTKEAILDASSSMTVMFVSMCHNKHIEILWGEVIPER